MRQRMYKEKKPSPGCLDIKQSRGGIVDVEFLAQYLILAYGAEEPQIMQKNTSKAIYAFKTANLLAAEDCQILEDAYYFYRLVENRLRLLYDRSENRIEPDPAVQRRLNRLCGLQPGENIIKILNEKFAAVYPIYERVLQKKA